MRTSTTWYKIQALQTGHVKNYNHWLHWVGIDQKYLVLIILYPVDLSALESNISKIPLWSPYSVCCNSLIAEGLNYNVIQFSKQDVAQLWQFLFPDLCYFILSPSSSFKASFDFSQLIVPFQVFFSPPPPGGGSPLWKWQGARQKFWKTWWLLRPLKYCNNPAGIILDFTTLSSTNSKI